MDVVIRRQLPNYKLPSESMDVLSSLVGKAIQKLETGLLVASVDAFLKKENVSYEDDLPSIPHGGPLFLSAQEKGTVVFNYDDFTRSIVLRETEIDLEDERFLEKLYEKDDYVPGFLKVKTLFDLGPYCDCVMKEIENVSIYKYPNNYLSKPIGYDAINEVAVGVMLSGGSELLIMSGLGKKHRSLGVAVEIWSDVCDENLSDLKCVWKAVCNSS